MDQSTSDDSLQSEYIEKFNRLLQEKDEMFPSAEGHPSMCEVAAKCESRCEVPLPFDAPQAELVSRSLSEQELKEIENSKRAALEAEYCDELARLQSAARLFSVPHWIRTLLVSLLGLISLAVTLALSAQIITGFRAVLSLPDPFAWCIGALYGMILLLAIALLCRCVWLFSKNRPAILRDFGHHSELRKRKRLQEIAQRNERSTIDELCDYLKQFDLEGRRAKVLRAWGLTEEVLSALSIARDRLLESSSSTDSRQWIQTFQLEFQEIINDASRQIVNKTAIRVGVATAASPDRLLDRLIVLGLTMGMFMQLLDIYRMRPSAIAASTLLLASFSHVYLAGSIQDVSESTLDDLGTSVSELTGSALAGFVGAQVGVRVSEGLVHALLVRRIGNAAINQISPVLPTR